MSSAEVRVRVRRGFILGLVITALLFLMGLVHVGEAFALGV
jgi:hypothetical protein